MHVSLGEPAGMRIEGINYMRAIPVALMAAGRLLLLDPTSMEPKIY